MKEEFKNIPITNLNHFEISKDGIVRNSKTGRIMKPRMEKDKYPRYQLFGDDKKQYKIYQSHLLYLTYGIGSPCFGY